ncbi:MAG: FAD:protein FMN transferase, partial [candidate division WOR-3 bacterium]
LVEVDQEISTIDSLFSIFSPKSEISLLNTQKRVKASKYLLSVVRRALEISNLSNGAFDITVYPLLELWGFYTGKKPKKIPDQPQLEKVKAAVDYRKIEIKGDSIILDNDTSIDLGGIAQGYAVECVINRLKARGIRSALVNIGGEVMAYGQKPDGGKWQIGIKHPRRPGIIKTITLDNEAVATSGDYEKFLMIKGKRYPHIIDPRTGMPARGLISVTIVAPDATTADGLATAIFVLGPVKGKTLLDSLPTVKGIIYTEDKYQAINTISKGL